MSGSTAKSDRKKVQRAIGEMAAEALVNHTCAINSLIRTVNALMVRVEALEARVNPATSVTYAPPAGTPETNWRLQTS